MGVAGLQKMDIVIPARGEAATVSNQLRALLAEGEGLQLSVVLVLNGEGVIEMSRRARPFVEVFAAAGHGLTVIESSTASKPAALNLGDECRSGQGAVVYLDADAMLLPGTLTMLASALDVPEPRLVGPRPHLVSDAGWLSRDWAAARSQLPSVRTFVGHGCYAVNSSGRARWRRFPDVRADDAYVLSRFDQHERQLVGEMLVELPHGSHLPQTVRRWADGNAELRARGLGDVGSPVLAGLGSLAARPALWPSLPAFVIVQARARFSRVRPGWSSGWEPVRGSGCEHGEWPSNRPTIRVVVVTCNSERHVEACLDSLSSRWADLDVVVVDNASSDRSVELARAHRLSPSVIELPTNVGFSAAANVGADGTTTEFVAFVHPDVVLGSDSLDALVALALRFPGSGLYGGRMHTPDGALGAWRRRGTREVPVLTAALLLVDRQLWTRLDGFDETYFLYGEDVDLSIRARAQGAQPMCTDTSTYRRFGGGSSPTAADQMVLILTGKVTVDVRHSRCPGLTRKLIVLGVALRACTEPFASPGLPMWRTVWRRRSEWRHGWTTSSTSGAGTGTGAAALLAVRDVV